MKQRRRELKSADAESVPNQSKDQPAPEARKKYGPWRKLGILVLVLAAIGAVGRAMLPNFVRAYVNRTLNRSLLYAGKIGEVQIHLWRGAYSIFDVRLSKKTGDVPVPLFAAQRVDFSIQWDALEHGRVVGRVSMFEPQLNL